MTEQKVWWKSKTFWVNVIAVGAIVAQSQFGYVLLPEGQVAILALINLILRKVTKEEIVWKE